LPNFRRSMNEPRACRQLYQICLQNTKAKRLRFYENQEGGRLSPGLEGSPGGPDDVGLHWSVC
jgi:hypothetical protein